MANKLTKQARMEILASIKKQAMAQQIVSDVNTQVDINDPNYTDKIMELILREVTDDIINES